MKKDNVEKLLNKTISSCDDLSKNLIDLLSACKGQIKAIKSITSMQSDLFRIKDELDYLMNDIKRDDNVGTLFGVYDDRVFNFKEEE